MGRLRQVDIINLLTAIPVMLRQHRHCRHDIESDSSGVASFSPRHRPATLPDTDGQHPRPVRVRRLMIVEHNLLGPNPFRRRRPWPKVPPDVAPQPETPPVLATPTLSDWVGQAAWLLDPVVAEIRQHVFAAEKIHGGHDRSGADAGARPDQNRAAVGLCAR
jgi:hypothetical protein